MNEQWSAATKEYTRVALEKLGFATRNGKVWLKHVDGHFGCMNEVDVLNFFYVIYAPTGGKLDKFDTVSALLENGWVLD